MAEGQDDYRAHLATYTAFNKLVLFTKVNAVLALFGGGMIVILGDAFIRRWVGEDYRDAYPVLAVLILAMVCEIIQNPASNVLYGRSLEPARLVL